MNISIANDSSLCERDDLFNADMGQSGRETKLTRKLWIEPTKSPEMPNVLDPNDSLMKKFQDALREHLSRVDKKLSDEILEFVSIPCPCCTYN